MNEKFSEVDLFFAETVLNKITPYNQQEAFFLSYLFFISRKGFIGLHIDNDVISPAVSLFGITESNDLRIAAKNLLYSGIVATCPEEESQKIICFENNTFYLQRNYLLKNKIMQALTSQPKEKQNDKFDEKIFFQELEKYSLSDEQKKTAIHSFSHHLTIICGGPGTGKTKTASAIAKMLTTSYLKEKIKIILTAPTAKASFHLKDKIENGEAITLHALLKMSRQKNLNKNKFIDADIIIVDEASMIDIKLMAFLFSSVLPTTKLILLGDEDQLFPVAPGEIFSFLADSSYAFTLREKFRFKNENLSLLAEALKEEDKNKFFSCFSSDNKISLMPFNESVFIKLVDQHFSQFYSSLPDIASLLQKRFTFAILSCLRLGPLGADDLNAKIINYLLQKLPKNNYFFAPIIITKNDYDLSLYNGTMGFLLFYKDNNGTISQKEAYFEDGTNLKKIPLFTSYEYGYVLSVHKSQGSEFDECVVIIPPGSETFGKKIIYTAISRAKEKLLLFASHEDLEKNYFTNN